MHDLFYIMPAIIPRPISAREAVEGWYPGWYGKGHVLISIFHM